MTAPLRRTIEAAVTFYDRPRAVQPDAPRRGRHGGRRPGRACRRQPASFVVIPSTDGRADDPQGTGPGEVTVIRDGPGCTTSRPTTYGSWARPQLEGWWQALGWSGRGMLLAPFLTELLAEHVVTGTAPGDAPVVPARPLQRDDASRGRPGRLLRALLLGSGCLGRLSGVVGTGLQRRARVVVGEDDLAAIAETGQPCAVVGSSRPARERAAGSEHLLIEADDDLAERLADRPSTLLRHAAVAPARSVPRRGPAGGSPAPRTRR